MSDEGLHEGSDAIYSDYSVLVGNLPPKTAAKALVIYFQSKAKSGGGEVASNGVVHISDCRTLVKFIDKEARDRVLDVVEHRFDGNVIRVEPCPRYLENQWITNETVVGAMDDKTSGSEYNIWGAQQTSVHPTLHVRQMCDSPDLLERLSAPSRQSEERSASTVGDAWNQSRRTPVSDPIIDQIQLAMLSNMTTGQGYHQIGAMRFPGQQSQLFPLPQQTIIQPGGYQFQPPSASRSTGPPPGFHLEDHAMGRELLDLLSDPQSESHPTTHDLVNTDDREQESSPRLLEVSGFASDITEETIEIFFESRKSGGGYIKNLSFDAARNKAIIEFENSEASDRVLEKGRLVLDGHELVVCEHRPKQAMPPTAIKVSGFKSTTSDQIIEGFFENQKKSGGGEIKRMHIHRHDGTALIDYGSNQVAERVCNMDELKLQGVVLLVVLCETDEFELLAAPTKSLALEVSGFNDRTSQDTIENFFENKKRSGGGPLKSFEQLAEGRGRTFKLVYHDVNDAQCVLEKRYLVLDEASLNVSLHEESHESREQHEETRESQTRDTKSDVETVTSTIKVSCIAPQTSEDSIENFFENRRKTGGGKIEKICLNAETGEAFISFVDPAAAERVFQRRLNLKLDGANLEIDKVRPPKLKMALPVDLYKVFVSNITDATTRDALENFLEAKSNCEVKEIQYGNLPGRALVTFIETPDVLKLHDICNIKLLEKTKLKIDEVRLTDAIQVHDLPNSCTDDMLENYFDNTRKSGGEDVTDVVIYDDGAVAVVEFANYSVVANVLAKERHVINKAVVRVAEYHQLLGFRHPDDDMSSPGVQLPTNTVVGPIDQAVMSFITTRPELKLLLDKELKSVHATVNWDSSSDTHLVVECLLTRGTQDSVSLSQSWEPEVKRFTMSFMDGYRCETITILQDIWQEVLTVFSADQGSGHLSSIMVETDDQTCEIRLTGPVNLVDATALNIRDKSLAIEEEFNRRSQQVKESISTLKSHQLRFLLACDFHKVVSNCNVIIKTTTIDFIGIPSEVNEAKVEMYERLHGLQSEKIGSTPATVGLLSHDACRQHVESKFRVKELIAVWELTNSDIDVYSTSRDAVRQAATIIQQEVTQAIVPIPDESKPIFRDKKWQDLKATNMAQHDGCLEILEDANLNELVIAATRPIQAGVLEVVHDFMEKNTLFEKLIPMNNGMVRFITIHKKDDYTILLGSLKQYFVDIQPITNAAQTGFTVKGTRCGLNMVTAKLVKIQGATYTTKYQVNKPGMSAFFEQKRGQDILDGIERRQACTIEMNGQDEDLTIEAGNAAVKDNGNDQLVCYAADSSGRKYCVYLGDMTKHKVDVIVNAANDRLEHIGGLAGAILKAGGREIQDESRQYIKTHGNLLDGQVVLTTNGRLPCKFIAHAVGPRWSGGNRGEENYLYDAVSNVIEEVERKGLTSVAIPAISCGVFRYPVDKSTRTIVEACNDYFKNKPTSCVREIHFIDNQTHITTAFKRALSSALGSSVTTAGGGMTTHQTGFDTIPSPRPVAAAWKSKGIGSNHLRTSGGVAITVKKGVLDTEQVDVVVNSVGKNLHLGSGAVSSSLLAAAGQQMQVDCANNYPNGVKLAEVAETNGYGLKCKRVYHGACAQWDGGQGKSEQILRRFVSSCLARAANSGHSSIAFPAIGTGILKIPQSIVAKAMFEEVCRFGSQAAGSSLKDVRFVVYGQDQASVQAFESENQRLLQGMPTYPTSSRHAAKPKRMVNPTSRGDTMSAASGPSVMIRGGVAVVTIRDITVEVLQGDLTKETTDGIVNPTNSQLNLSSGQVTQAIVRAGGRAIIDECSHIGHTKDGFAVTGSGNLPCQYVIHLDVGNGVSTKTIKTCLKAADQYAMQSLALPIIGTGMHSCSVEEATTAIFEAISEFSKKRRSLKILRIVIFQQDMVQNVHRFLEEMIKQSSKKGFFKRVWDKAWDVILGPSTDKIDEISDISYREKEVTFTICADNARSLENATADIEQCCKDEIKDLIIGGSPGSDYDAIGSLREGELKAIATLQQTHNVKIDVENRPRVRRIRIQGTTEQAYSAKSDVDSILGSVKERERQREQADLLAKHVQWMFLDSARGKETWVPYSPEANLTIETAHGKGEGVVRFTEADDSCEITFSRNEETIIGKTDVTPVKRIERGALDLPKTWSVMRPGDDVCVVDLKPTDPEYRQVDSQFQATQPSQIFKIQRIQNPRLFKAYTVHHQHLDKRNPPGTKNERVLYHGTGSDNVAKINRTGFNRSFCGANAVVYGMGVYFADTANYSARNQYARPDQRTGHKHVYQCRVLTGEYVVGNQHMKEPPAKDPLDATILYDSTVDDANNPSIFVVFNDNQVYPDYLITFN